jgi:threonylcarbamoyladenosine tRNA methylthiotransferase MtaB
MSAPIRLHDPQQKASRRPRFAICTLGCKLNQADESDLRRDLQIAGLTEVPFSDEADVYIVNTCTVTHLADRRSRQMLRRARRMNEQALVAAVGCYPQASPDELEAMQEVDLVVDSLNKRTVVDDVLGHMGTPHASFDLEPGEYFGERTRRMIKIQEGCRAHCTYCVIPTARGGPQNFDPDLIREQIDSAVAAGVQEVVLTGTHVGTYKWKTAEGHIWRLADLLEYLLDTTAIPRLRITSVGPHEIESRFIDLLHHPRLMPHLHMALQSGSPTVLRRMKRWYNLQQFRRSVRQLREAIPEIGLTTDVIVGFPDETDEEFEETMQFVHEMQFSDLHVFLFSPRRGTEAASMNDSVPHRVKEERSARLRELGRALSDSFRDSQAGRLEEALLEEKVVRDDCDTQWRSGLTRNYLRVYVPESPQLHPNQIVSVLLKEPFRDGVIAAPTASVQ